MEPKRYHPASWLWDGDSFYGSGSTETHWYGQDDGDAEFKMRLMAPSLP